MYWEEVIELIKAHGDEPKSTFPNQYNDSDDYDVYEYERGTVKTSYIDIDEFSEKLKDCFKKYLKYGLKNYANILPHLAHHRALENMQMKEMF